MKKYILPLLVTLQTLSFADNIGSDKDMALSISDTRYSISGDNFKEIVGFEAMLGRTSDFGKIFIAYDEGSSKLFEKQSYRVGVDVYLIKNKVVNLSTGINIGSGKLEEKTTSVDMILMTYGLSAQVDIKFGDSLHGFTRMSYYKNFQLEECKEGSKCFNSNQLKDLSNFNTRAISIGITWNF